MQAILDNHRFQNKLGELANEYGLSFEKVRKDAEKYLKELYTEHQPLVGLAGVESFRFLLSRGYDKSIDVNPEEIKKITRLMRRHPVAFVVTHKTYIDTVVLSIVLGRHGLPLPLMFAGINMGFMGVKQLGKKAGLIFIRRSFKDNHVYKATLRHYIATLLDQKASFMWAIEGTRSRTGKLVWPKMGILKYIMEGEQDTSHKVKYVPVSLVYDLIPDVKEMTKEGRGKNKKPESLLWFINYFRKMNDKLGRISLRFGDPVDISDEGTVNIPIKQNNLGDGQSSIPLLAFELVHSINRITPVTTTSLICNALLSKYSLPKAVLDNNVADLMHLIESHKPDALVDRGIAVGESVQKGLNLLLKAGLVRKVGEGLNSKYAIVAENYLEATYYANMAVHHLYQRAFIEMALLKVIDVKSAQRELAFWEEIMSLRNLFKFEFFYSKKSSFSDKIEADFAILDQDWGKKLNGPKTGLSKLLKHQSLLIAPVVLYTYLEAYKIVGRALQNMDPVDHFDEKAFLEACLALGEELHWQGQIHRLESVSKPFLLNGIRLVRNLNIIPAYGDRKEDGIKKFQDHIQDCTERIRLLQEYTLDSPTASTALIPLEQRIVPGSKTDVVTKEIFEGESGAHIGAFFDLDRTLIDGFSAKQFVQTLIMKGKLTRKELVAQFAAGLVYATGNTNFSNIVAIGANGVKGVKEQVFIDVGEEVYREYLADHIYPEARALVAAHFEKGHTVAIVSAATPYQVNPVAHELGIEHIMCTRLEVENGIFTGKIIDPACWGEGKAKAGRLLADQLNLDLSKSYFYTDSVADLPLLEIVGNPRPLNPDVKLSSIAFENDWPINKLNDEARPTVTNVVRTGLAAGSMIPAVLKGVTKGASRGSWSDGINAMVAAFGDIGTAMAGIKLVVKGEENLWSHRPAVFIFNHQSGADMFIGAKLVRKDVRAIAKKSLKYTPIGPFMMAAGVIFIDRGNRDKAIDAMKPAVEAMQNGISVVIAPEGTRSKGYELGPFKKGAFHLAMQAGVPVVPIVITNAHDALPKGKTVFTPAAVEVSVLKPIPTDDWNKGNLNEKIREVRELYLRELGQL
ncbi:MAG: HAD-IB family hydrolase [Bacteroidota bacterium]